MEQSGQMTDEQARAAAQKAAEEAKQAEGTASDHPGEGGSGGAPYDGGPIPAYTPPSK